MLDALGRTYVGFLRCKNLWYICDETHAGIGGSLRTSIVLDFEKKTANQVAETPPKDSQLQKTIPLGFRKSCFCIFRGG